MNKSLALKRQHNKPTLKVSGISTLSAMAIYGINIASAATVFERARSILDGLYSDIGTVVTSLAVLCIGFCAVKWIMASDPQSVKQAKTWLFTILCGVLLYWLAPTILATIESIV